MKKFAVVSIILNFVLIWGFLGFLYMDIFFPEKLKIVSNGTINPHHSVLVQSFNLPDTIVFCGEKVPLHDPEVRERLDKDLFVNAYMHANMSLIIKRANRWFPKITEILKKEGIPEDFKYLCAIESGLENVSSYKQAVGFWQILAPTGKELGLKINDEIDERYDPILATYAAVKFLKKSKEKFGTWTVVAASYNMGISGVGRSLNAQFTDSYYDLWLNPETARYIYRILAYKIIMENQVFFDFHLKKEHLYEELPTQKVAIDTTINNLQIFAKQINLSYKLLKYYNPALRSNKITVEKGSNIFINLPQKPIKHGVSSDKNNDTFKGIWDWVDSTMNNQQEDKQ